MGRRAYRAQSHRDCRQEHQAFAPAQGGGDGSGSLRPRDRAQPLPRELYTQQVPHLASVGADAQGRGPCVELHRAQERRQAESYRCHRMPR